MALLRPAQRSPLWPRICAALHVHTPGGRRFPASNASVSRACGTPTNPIPSPRRGGHFHCTVKRTFLLDSDTGHSKPPPPVRGITLAPESPIISEPGDLTIAVGYDVAYAYGLQHMTGKKKGGPEADLWFRATARFRREAGRWRITHMHNSVPFAMDGSDKALLDLKP
jgi:hypothetical protein